MAIYVLIVGIDKYLDENIPDLKHAVDDALEIRKVLKNRLKEKPTFKILISPVESKAKRIPGEAINQAIRMSIEKASENSKKGDTFIFFYAGHGIKKDNSEYLIAQDTRLKDLKNTAIPIIFIKNQIEKSKFSNIILIFDMCRTDIKSSTRDTLVIELPKNIIDKFRKIRDKKIGVIFSTKLGYKAGEEKGHGVFTGTLIEVLKKVENFNVKEVFNKVVEEISDRNYELEIYQEPEKFVNGEIVIPFKGNLPSLGFIKKFIVFLLSVLLLFGKIYEVGQEIYKPISNLMSKLFSQVSDPNLLEIVRINGDVEKFYISKNAGSWLSVFKKYDGFEYVGTSNGREFGPFKNARIFWTDEGRWIGVGFNPDYHEWKIFYPAGEVHETFYNVKLPFPDSLARKFGVLVETHGYKKIIFQNGETSVKFRKFINIRRSKNLKGWVAVVENHKKRYLISDDGKTYGPYTLVGGLLGDEIEFSEDGDFWVAKVSIDGDKYIIDKNGVFSGPYDAIGKIYKSPYGKAWITWVAKGGATKLVTNYGEGLSLSNGRIVSPSISNDGKYWVAGFEIGKGYVLKSNSLESSDKFNFIWDIVHAAFGDKWIANVEFPERSGHFIYTSEGGIFGSFEFIDMLGISTLGNVWYAKVKIGGKWKFVFYNGKLEYFDDIELKFAKFNDSWIECVKEGNSYYILTRDKKIGNFDEIVEFNITQYGNNWFAVTTNKDGSYIFSKLEGKKGPFLMVQWIKFIDNTPYWVARVLDQSFYYLTSWGEKIYDEDVVIGPGYYLKTKVEKSGNQSVIKVYKYGEGEKLVSQNR